MKTVGRKIAIFVSATLFLTCILCLQVFATEIETYDFINFTEEESMAFVEQCNIVVPEAFQTSEELPLFTQKLVLRAYLYPDIEFCFNSYETQNYAEAIRAAVRLYTNLETVPAVASESVGYLQYNTILNANGEWKTSGGVWNPKWSNYNCYAYAINRVEIPGFYNTGWRYTPGDMNGTMTWNNIDRSISTLAAVVEADLNAMGFSNIVISSERPEIDESQELICIRMFGVFDYHFMRFDKETNAWYHKPGDSAVLKYNQEPSNNVHWYLETVRPASDGTMVVRVEEDVQYDSSIIFITYTKKQINIIATDTEVMRTVTISPQKDVLYELNFECLGIYIIHMASTNRFTFDVYDENFNEVLSDSANASLSETFHVTGNKYYLRMNFVVDSTHPPLTSDCSITVSLVPYGAITD